MKEKTTLNYLIIIFAWCFFLSKLEFVSFILLFVSSLVLFLTNRNINFSRFLTTFIIFIISLFLLIKISELDSFYSSIKYFSIVLSFNLAALNETQSLLNIKSLFMFYVVSLILTLLFVVVAIALPDSLYTIFTKAHLYSLIGLIFVPYVSDLTVLVAIKTL